MNEAFIDAFRVFEEQRKELKALLKEYCWGWMEGLPTMEITRECDSGKEYRKRLKNEGYSSWRQADAMLDTIKIEETDEKNLTLVKVTLKDLGLTENSTGRQILEAAKKKGLKRCPTWVGPQYRLDCNDGEFTTIGMEPVLNSAGMISVFRINHGGSNNLIDHSDIRSKWFPIHKWVFVVRK